MSTENGVTRPQSSKGVGGDRGQAVVLLAVSAVLLLFANGHNTVAIAAWLAPLFLLRFVRGGSLGRLLAAYGVVTATRGSRPDPVQRLAGHRLLAHPDGRVPCDRAGL